MQRMFYGFQSDCYVAHIGNFDSYNREVNIWIIGVSIGNTERYQLSNKIFEKFVSNWKLNELNKEYKYNYIGYYKEFDWIWCESIIKLCYIYLWETYLWCYSCVSTKQIYKNTYSIITSCISYNIYFYFQIIIIIM